MASSRHKRLRASSMGSSATAASKPDVPMLGYTSNSQFGRYATTFVQFLESFAPVSDSRILSIQPKRIDVVRVDRDQTLEQFARNFHPQCRFNNWRFSTTCRTAPRDSKAGHSSSEWSDKRLFRSTRVRILRRELHRGGTRRELLDIGPTELSTQEHDLRGVIDPYQDHDHRSGRSVPLRQSRSCPGKPRSELCRW